ncbi:MAG TPA: tetratricopeptide repeat protein [Nitrospirota bacterium]|nr:tetratricopeptide repeat protein [Nitrospirota bacterium]
MDNVVPATLLPVPPPISHISLTEPEQAIKTALDAGKAGNWETMLLLSRQIAEQYPNTIWYRRSLFLSERAFILLDRESEAESAMLRIRAEYPEMADYAVYLLAEYSYSKGRYSKAAALYEVLMENYPESSLRMKSEYQRGLALLGMYVYPQAVDAFTKFLEAYPHSELAPDAGLGLGRALTAEVQLEQAACAYRNVWIKTPGTDADLEAEKTLAEMRTLGVEIPDYTADDLYERGKTLARMGQNEKAVEAFMKILSKDAAPSYRSDVLLRAGVALFNMNRRADSAVILEQMVHDYPEDPRVPEALYWMGRCYSKLGDGERGIRAFQKLLERFPQSDWADDALFFTANIYREAGDMKNALLFYERLSREYPDSRFADSAIWWRAWSFYTSSDYRRSEQTLQELVNRYPRSFLANQSRYWQGRAAEKMGNRSRAAAYYEEVLRKGPYTYYGYRAAERKARLEAAITDLKTASTNSIDIDDVCGGTFSRDEPMNSFDIDAGPPEWTAETRQVLSGEPSYQKSLELMSLDMKKEAAQELWALEGSVPRKQGMSIALSRAFFDLGDYYHSLQLVLRNYERYLERPREGIPDDLWLLAYPQGYWESILSYAQKYGQDPYYIAAIVREESQFFSGALSPAGARGLMQVMPTTGEWVARRIKLDRFDQNKLFDADTGINVGTWYIGYLMKQFKGDPLLVAAAYNAGPDAVTAWLAKFGFNSDRDAFVEEIPYAETRGYVKKVLRNYGEYRRIYGKSAGSTLLGSVSGN